MTQNDIAEIIQNKIGEILFQEDRLKTNCIQLTIVCDGLKAKKNEMGPQELLLNRCLNEIKVVRQVYHENAFVDNHCKLVLKNYAKLCRVIADQEEDHEKFLKILEAFQKIQSLAFLKSRFLSEAEIVCLKQNCNRFGELFPCLFPDSNITRKIHECIFSIPRFAEQFKTLGLLTEEEGERLHAAVNMELRQLVCLRNPAEKMQLLMKRQELRSQAPKNLLKKVPRLCVKCK